MKKLLFLLLIFLSTNTFADTHKKSAFYLALTSQAPLDASFTFMLDQYLSKKCGKEQTLELVNKNYELQLKIILLLKKGKYDQAKDELNSIACDIGFNDS